MFVPRVPVSVLYNLKGCAEILHFDTPSLSYASAGVAVGSLTVVC